MANLAESSDRNEASDGHQLGAFKQLQFHKSATVWRTATSLSLQPATAPYQSRSRVGTTQFWSWRQQCTGCRQHATCAALPCASRLPQLHCPPCTLRPGILALQITSDSWSDNRWRLKKRGSILNQRRLQQWEYPSRDGCKSHVVIEMSSSHRPPLWSSQRTALQKGRDLIAALAIRFEAMELGIPPAAPKVPHPKASKKLKRRCKPVQLTFFAAYIQSCHIAYY